MGVVATARVVTGTDRAGRPRIIQPGNREWVTIIKCINTMGGAIIPLVIFEAVMTQQIPGKSNVPNKRLFAIDITEQDTFKVFNTDFSIMTTRTATHQPDTTAISLTRLLSRLEHTLLSPETDPNLRKSSYERTKVGAVGNLLDKASLYSPSSNGFQESRIRSITSLAP
jgi:hypothetical protein